MKATLVNGEKKWLVIVNYYNKSVEPILAGLEALDSMLLRMHMLLTMTN